MRRTTMGLCFLLLAILEGNAAGERIPAGGRALGMGGASVAGSDLWSLTNNPAGTAWLQGFSAGLGFEDPFLLRSLMTEQLGLAIALRPGTFGLFASRFGSNLYSELKAGLVYARKFGKRLSVGIEFNFQRIHIADNYGNRNMVSCEIGLQYHAGEHLVIGVQVLNPMPVKVASFPPSSLPVTVCTGLSWVFSEKFLLTLEVEKDLFHPLLLRGGAEYHLAKPLRARAGFNSNPACFTFGFGLEFGHLSFEMAACYHQVLGFTPSGSLTCTF